MALAPNVATSTDPNPEAGKSGGKTTKAKKAPAKRTPAKKTAAKKATR